MRTVLNVMFSMYYGGFSDHRSRYDLHDAFLFLRTFGR